MDDIGDIADIDYEAELAELESSTPVAVVRKVQYDAHFEEDLENLLSEVDELDEIMLDEPVGEPQRPGGAPTSKLNQSSLQESSLKSEQANENIPELGSSRDRPMLPSLGLDSTARKFEKPG